MNGAIRLGCGAVPEIEGQPAGIDQVDLTISGNNLQFVIGIAVRSQMHAIVGQGIVRLEDAIKAEFDRAVLVDRQRPVDNQIASNVEKLIGRCRPVQRHIDIAARIERQVAAKVEDLSALAEQAAATGNRGVAANNPMTAERTARGDSDRAGAVAKLAVVKAQTARIDMGIALETAAVT